MPGIRPIQNIRTHAYKFEARKANLHSLGQVGSSIAINLTGETLKGANPFANDRPRDLIDGINGTL